ncbi:MAG TPA: carbamoyl phosphate synthase large subunit, partial [bacterium]|nr:carbamoyl phosphate synthase large subunit [bacterium]
GTQMKSVGEVMGIGRTFKESLQKAMRSLEIGKSGFDEVKIVAKKKNERLAEIAQNLITPVPDRLWWIGEAFRYGFRVKEIHDHTKIDPWFLEQIREIIDYEERLRGQRLRDISQKILREAKRLGFSDMRLARLFDTTEDQVRQKREKTKMRPVFKTVDTCAAEFTSFTPYYYSTYETENEVVSSKKKKVVILGGGPNRIGQGIEFDYCCCHACASLREEGYEVVMVNCNPETVSTDYDTSDRLYFEPLTKEDVIRILQEEKPIGIIVQFGGQTPLKLSKPLEKWGARILGTSSNSIDRVEDRKRFSAFIKKLRFRQPENGIATSLPEAIKAARRIGYPVLVRPSYVLGGRAMEIVYDEKSLCEYMHEAVRASEERPVLVDRFLENAIEVDVDALCDGKVALIGG